MLHSAALCADAIADALPQALNAAMVHISVERRPSAVAFMQGQSMPKPSTSTNRQQSRKKAQMGGAANPHAGFAEQMRSINEQIVKDNPPARSASVAGFVQQAGYTVGADGKQGTFMVLTLDSQASFWRKAAAPGGESWQDRIMVHADATGGMLRYNELKLLHTHLVIDNPANSLPGITPDQRLRGVIVSTLVSNLNTQAVQRDFLATTICKTFTDGVPLQCWMSDDDKAIPEAICLAVNNMRCVALGSVINTCVSLHCLC
jgi:hypothetical protein